MFNKKDRQVLKNLADSLSRNNSYLFDKIHLEKVVDSLKTQIIDLKEKKASLKFTDGMYQGRVYVMRTPFEENCPMCYLQDYSDYGYHWTTNKEKAEQYSFEEAYRIKKSFCAFKDTKENLLIVCVDDIVDEGDNEYKSYLLKSEKRDLNILIEKE